MFFLCLFPQFGWGRTHVAFWKATLKRDVAKATSTCYVSVVLKLATVRQQPYGTVQIWFEFLRLVIQIEEKEEPLGDCAAGAVPVTNCVAACNKKKTELQCQCRDVLPSPDLTSDRDLALVEAGKLSYGELDFFRMAQTEKCALKYTSTT